MSESNASAVTAISEVETSKHWLYLETVTVVTLLPIVMFRMGETACSYVG